MIVSGGSDGLIAVSSPTTGMTVRVISDHKGVAISSMDTTLTKVAGLHNLKKKKITRTFIVITLIKYLIVDTVATECCNVQSFLCKLTLDQDVKPYFKQQSC